MNNIQQRSVYGGIALIVLGVLFLTGLIGWLPVLLLAGGGAALYVTQRSRGQLDQALLGGLWGVGLALTWLTGQWIAGLLLLGGLTMLMRGREAQVDAMVQSLMGRAGTAIQSRRTRPSSPSIAHTPTISSTTPSPVTIIREDVPTTGETTRLR